MEVDNLKVVSAYSTAEQMAKYSPQLAKAKEPTENGEVHKIKKSEKNNKKESDKPLSEAERYANRKEHEISESLISKAIEKANVRLKGSFRQLQFSIHEKTNRVMIKVINSETQEIIREIPPESTLDTFAKVLELAGLMVDEKR